MQKRKMQASIPLLATIKDVVEIIQGLATVLALIVAGVWSYKLFVQQREEQPRAKISYEEVSNRTLGNGKTLLHVTILIENTGKTLLQMHHGKIWVEQVRPVDSELLTRLNECVPQKPCTHPLREGQWIFDWLGFDIREIEWKEGDVQLEPGEFETFEADFFIDPKVKTVRIYSFFSNPTIRNAIRGWQKSILYDVQDEKLSEGGESEKKTINLP